MAVLDFLYKWSLLLIYNFFRQIGKFRIFCPTCHFLNFDFYSHLCFIIDYTYIYFYDDSYISHATDKMQIFPNELVEKMRTQFYLGDENLES